VRGWHRVPAGGDRPASVVFPAAGIAVEAVGWAGADPVVRPGPGPGRTGTPTRLHPDRDSRAGLLRFGLPELTGRPQAVLAAIAAAVTA
jgi:hypothetical protein